ncbi:hypothetical protein H0H87_006979 [Tephrocybe sp. NHM501043]|nr:hypothetical protein H0H87_006979 [Tephrocybe sp. NHM501043]
MATRTKLSLEVIFVILSQLDDHKTLSACSMTSSRLRNEAQRRLFQKASITVGSVKSRSGNADEMCGLTEFLLSNKHIAQSVRSLTIRVLEDINGASSVSLWPSNKTLLNAFPSVQRLIIVDIGRSRYRGWWDMGGAFAEALRTLLQQQSVAALQLGAPGIEREFDWPPHEDFFADTVGSGLPYFTDLHGASTNEGGAIGRLRDLRASMFRDRPDNLRTVQGVLRCWATSLNHVWLAFPSHSLPYNRIDAAISLQDLIVLKSLKLSFNADRLIRPVLQILDTISERTYGVLNLTLRIQRSKLSLSPSVIMYEHWRDLDSHLTWMLDRLMLRTLKVEIAVFEMDHRVVEVLREVLLGVDGRNCLVFKER